MLLCGLTPLAGIEGEGRSSVGVQGDGDEGTGCPVLEVSVLRKACNH